MKPKSDLLNDPIIKMVTNEIKRMIKKVESEIEITKRENVRLTEKLYKLKAAREHYENA